jgi:hypothetical protein
MQGNWQSYAQSIIWQSPEGCPGSGPVGCDRNSTAVADNCYGCSYLLDHCSSNCDSAVLNNATTANWLAFGAEVCESAYRGACSAV